MIKLIALLLAAIAMMGGFEPSLAQYDEICHYECAITYCDPYSDFCDYDCYEVCYPYRSQQVTPGVTIQRIFGLRPVKTARNQATSSPVKQHVSSSQSRNTNSEQSANSSGNGHAGKGVRMRIQRVPKVHQVINGQTRDYPRPENFALFQSCL